jgi:hypothetical protein
MNSKFIIHWVSPNNDTTRKLENTFGSTYSINEGGGGDFIYLPSVQDKIILIRDLLVALTIKAVLTQRGYKTSYSQVLRLDSITAP